MASLRAPVSRMVSNYLSNLKKMSPAERAIKKLSFDKSSYPQLGMVFDDTLYENNAVQEAVRRLPREEREMREFRISRAIHLSMNKQILPKEEWTTLETDLPYLGPYLDLVKKEEEEFQKWENM